MKVLRWCWIVVAVVGQRAWAGGEGLDYSALTGRVSFDDVGPAVLAAAGALVGIYVIVKGVRMVIGFVGGGAAGGGGAEHHVWTQADIDRAEAMDDAYYAQFDDQRTSPD